MTFLFFQNLFCIAEQNLQQFLWNCNNEFEILGTLGIMLWISSMAIQYELNKEKPKNWFITLVTGPFLVSILLALFN